MGSRCSTEYRLLDQFKNQTIVNVNVMRGRRTAVILRLCCEDTRQVADMELRFLTCYDQDGPLQWNRVSVAKLQGSLVHKGWSARKKYSLRNSTRNRIYLLVDVNRCAHNLQAKGDYRFYRFTGAKIIRITESLDLPFHHSQPASVDRKASIEGALIIDLITHDENSDDQQTVV